MATLSIIEFCHDDPDGKFSICRTCGTHIALGEDFIVNCSVEGVDGGLFAKAVNVHAPTHQRLFGPSTIADLYCMGCGDDLSWKFVRWLLPPCERVPPDDLDITEEMVQLLMHKLRYWNGNSILDAETREPVPEDD